MSSRCNHIDHVTTQMPYALVVGTVALLVGTIPVGFGMPWWLGLMISATALGALFFAISRVTPADEAVSA
jgi:Na+/H+ antiporter NhaC